MMFGKSTNPSPGLAPHTAILEVVGGRLKLRNSASVKEHILKEIQTLNGGKNLFYIPAHPTEAEVTAGWLNRMWAMKTGGPIEAYHDVSETVNVPDMINTSAGTWKQRDLPPPVGISTVTSREATRPMDRKTSTIAGQRPRIWSPSRAAFPAVEPGAQRRHDHQIQNPVEHGESLVGPPGLVRQRGELVDRVGLHARQASGTRDHPGVEDEPTGLVGIGRATADRLPEEAPSAVLLVGSPVRLGDDDVPVTLDDVSDVQLGPALRRGVGELDEALGLLRRAHAWFLSGG